MANEPDNANKYFKMSLEIPFWDGSEDKLERFIQDCQLLKDLELFANDKQLIYSVLTKSKQTQLYESMSDDQTKELDKFSEFLRLNFGRNNYAKWQAIENLKQRDGEKAPAFFVRCRNTFYHARNAKAPDDIPVTEQEEIKHRFMKGLKNANVRNQVRMNSANIEFDKLGENAKQIEDAINADTSNTTQVTVSDIAKAVNAITINDRMRGKSRSYDRKYERRNRSYSRNRDRSYGRQYGRRYSRGRRSGVRYERNQTPYRNRRVEFRISRSGSRRRDESDYRESRTCYNCNKKGHISKDCRKEKPNVQCFKCGYHGHTQANCQASNKTIASYRRRDGRQGSKHND